MLFETSYDPELIAAYVRQGVTLDAMPYTEAFEALFQEVANKIEPAPQRADLFHRLHNLRKAGRLPRLGHTPTPEGGPARLMEEQEARLIMIVENKIGELSKRDQLLYQPAFDDVVSEFNEATQLQLKPSDIWRITAKLAKRPGPRKQDNGVSDTSNHSQPANKPVYRFGAAHNTVLEGFTDQAVNNLEMSFERITHCVDQLTDEQVWFRPKSSMNAIGNLLLHLCGNLDQWIIAGLTNTPCMRNRQSEFDQRGPIPKDELMANLRRVVGACTNLISRVGDDEQLLSQRHIQDWQTNGLTAVFHAVSHFEGHTQEIICLTRMQLGDKYKFAWAPKTK